MRGFNCRLNASSAHQVGTLGARPAAAVGNNGFLYLATDVDGGTLYRSNGVGWVQAAGLSRIAFVAQAAASAP